MRFRYLLIIGLLVGLVLGVSLAAIFSESDGDSDDVASPDTTIPEGQKTSLALQESRSESFLDDWVRFRTVVGLVESELTRVTADGEELTVTEVLAQRPGDRLVRSLSGVTGYLGGVEVLCSSKIEVEDGGELECQDLVGAPSIDDALETEVGNISALLTGDPPTYRIFETPEGCWELILTIETFDAAFGDESIYCFNPTTGQLESSETTFNNGLTESTRVVAAKTEVTDDDLLALLNQPPRS